MSMTEVIRKKKRRIAYKVGQKVLWSLERMVEKASLVDNTAFLDPRVFAWTQMLEENWRVIRAELDEVLQNKRSIPAFHEISPDQKSITDDDQWKTFFLYGMGFKAEKNCARCPETTRLVEQVPHMTTAFFSILSPGKHIPAHRGVFKGFVRYHLGLMVPEPREHCRIRVGEEIRVWEEGKSMMFDDTYDHEVWNDTEGVRVVLFMDVLRPVRFPVSALNRALIWGVQHSSYVQDAKKNQEHWETRVDAARAEFEGAGGKD